MATPISDAQLRARAIARWEGEGGALSPSNGSDASDEHPQRPVTTPDPAQVHAPGDHRA
jgi:hypothetical protein